MTNKEAIAWLNNLITSIGEPQHSSLWHYEKALSEIKDMLGVLPSAECPKGQWIYHKDNMPCVRWDRWECDQCHNRTEYISDYCPNCGARMKGEEYAGKIELSKLRRSNQRG